MGDTYHMSKDFIFHNFRLFEKVHAMPVFEINMSICSVCHQSALRIVA